MAKCLNNMDAVLQEYQFRLIDGKEGESKELLEKVIKDLKAKCPSGAEYVVTEEKAADGNSEEESILKLVCPIHGGDRTEGAANRDFENVKLQRTEMEKFLTMSENDIKALPGWTEYNPDAKNNLSNSTFRNYILQKEYGGEWPALSQELLEQIGDGKQKYYIQPYLNGSYKDPNSNITIYASTHQNTSGTNLWATNLIYRDGQWFYNSSGKTINLVNKSEENIKELTKDWIPLKMK